MTEFLNPVDIGNRALQHCGQPMMSVTQGFAEDSDAARQVSFAYGKLRRAELRRNVWTKATRRTVLRPITDTTMMLVPAMWDPTATYFVGSIVSDQYNNLWQSRYPNNLNFQPENSTTWEPYFGPLTVSLYDADDAYHAAELVYTTDGDGTYRVFASLRSDNEDDPTTTPTWDADTTYFKNQVVVHSAVEYMSLIDLNTGQTPSATPANWSIATTYSIGNQVVGTDLQIYTSAANGNVGNDPVSDTGTFWTRTGIPAPWTTTFTAGTVSSKWLQVGGAEFPSGVALATVNMIYPITSGPTMLRGRNVYRLPNGYLRAAHQEPKGGIISYSGTSGALPYNDWTFENDFLVSGSVQSIMLRFVADVTDVSKMDDMFCEGLAARIAMAVCEPLTQSTSKLSALRQIYQDVMGEARTANAIETGAEMPPEDDYITTRA